MGPVILQNTGKPYYVELHLTIYVIILSSADSLHNL